MKIKETLKRTIKWIFEDFKDPKFCIWTITLLAIEIILYLGAVKVTNNFDASIKFAFLNTILIMMCGITLKVGAKVVIDTLDTLKDIRNTLKDTKKN